MPDWRQYLYYKKVCVKTTWTLRVGVLVVLILTVALTRGFWIGQIGRSLVCARLPVHGGVRPSR